MKDMTTQTRGFICRAEEQIALMPNARFDDDCFPLEHFHLDGMYVRKITMAAGNILTSKIHKQNHPYFILKGDISVLTENGIVRLKAPYFGITKAGTKRILYTHEDTFWYTCHSVDSTDLKEIEEQVIAKSYEELGLEVHDPDISMFLKDLQQKECI